MTSKTASNAILLLHHRPTQHNNKKEEENEKSRKREKVCELRAVSCVLLRIGQRSTKNRAHHHLQAQLTFLCVPLPLHTIPAMNSHLIIAPRKKKGAAFLWFFLLSCFQRRPHTRRHSALLFLSSFSLLASLTSHTFIISRTTATYESTTLTLLITHLLQSQLCVSFRE